jgi:hypothetical protein
MDIQKLNETVSVLIRRKQYVQAESILSEARRSAAAKADVDALDFVLSEVAGLCHSPCSRSVGIFPSVRALRSQTKNASFDFPGYPNNDKTSGRNRSKHAVAKCLEHRRRCLHFFA